MVKKRKSLAKKKKTQLKSSPVIEGGGMKTLSFLHGRLWTAALLVAVLTFIIYLPALQNDFVNWDDGKYITENKNIQFFDLKLLKWSFTSFYASNWHPLTWLSHAVDYAIWGLNPLGHHLSSIVLHSLNTFLLSIFLVYLILNAKSSESLVSKNDENRFKRAMIAGGVTALLFGIHPVHVESVAWVAERKDVLSVFFVFLSLIFYVKYVVMQRLKKETFYYISSLVFFVLALMSKPMAVTLPVMLVILDIYPFQRFSFSKGIEGQKKILMEKIPFFFLSLVSSIITIIAQHAGGAVKSLEDFSLLMRVGIAIRGICFYLLKMVFPVGLYPLYPISWDMYSLVPECIVSSMLVIGITLFCIRAWRKNQKIFLAVWVFYVVTLLPVLGIIQVGSQAAADRYTYIPSIGPFLLIGLGISLVWEKSYVKDRAFILNRKLIILTSILILFLLSVLTVKQIKIWKDSITLWTHELEKYPDEEVAFISRANAYIGAGDYQKAISHLDKVIEKDSRYAEAYYNRAKVYEYLGDSQKVINDLNKAIKINPEYTGAYINRSHAFVISGEYIQALKDLDRAIKSNPDSAEAYNNRGLIYKKIGDHQSAVKDFTRAVELYPKYAEAYNNRATVYIKLGDYQMVLKDLNRAIELKPGLAGLYVNRCETYNIMADYEQAIRDCSRAIEIDPENLVAYKDRASSYNALERYQEAVRDYQNAARLGDRKIQEILKEKGIGW